MTRATKQQYRFIALPLIQKTHNQRSARSPLLIQKKFTVKRDDDATSIRISLLLHIHGKINGAHNAVTEFFMDDFFDGSAVCLHIFVKPIKEDLEEPQCPCPSWGMIETLPPLHGADPAALLLFLSAPSAYCPDQAAPRYPHRMSSMGHHIFPGEMSAHPGFPDQPCCLTVFYVPCLT